MVRARFPRTPHVVNGPLRGAAVTRDDLTLKPEEESLFIDPRAHPPTLQLKVTVEEKLDGANVGFSLDADGGTIRAQNRSHYVNGATAAQWGGLPRFIDAVRDELRGLFYAVAADDRAMHAVTAALPAHVASHGLGQASGAEVGDAAPSENPACDWILFGEWLALQHSVFYDALPAPFLAFDLYHVPSRRFLAADLRDALLTSHCPSIVSVPRVSSSRLGVEVASWDDIHRLWHQRPSHFFASLGAKARDATAQRSMEGVVVRLDDARVGVQLLRCKAVHDEFVAAIDEHWRKKAPVKNIVVV